MFCSGDKPRDCFSGSIDPSPATAAKATSGLSAVSSVHQVRLIVRGLPVRLDKTYVIGDIAVAVAHLYCCKPVIYWPIYQYLSLNCLCTIRHCDRNASLMSNKNGPATGVANASMKDVDEHAVEEDDESYEVFDVFTHKSDSRSTLCSEEPSRPPSGAAGRKMGEACHVL